MQVLKKQFFLFLFCSFCSSLVGQEINSKVTEVTIYPYGAKVTRLAQVQLKSGSSKLNFGDLENGVDFNTIEVNISNSQVNIQGIEGIKTRAFDYNKSPEWIGLNDSIYILDQEINWIKEQQSIYLEEEKIVNKNSALGTQANDTKVVDLKNLLTFYRTQLFEIRKKKLELNRTLQLQLTLKKELERKRTNLQNGKLSNQIQVAVSTPLPTSSALEFSYFVKNVFWKAVYDLKAKDTKHPMELTYRAEINQHTGVDWPNVKVFLSNAKPTSSKKQPSLKPLYAAFKYGQIDTVMAFDPETYEERIQVVRNDSKLLSDMEKVTRELTTSKLTEVDGLRDIPSNSRSQFINIQSVQLPTNYQYVCIPKKDIQVYLLAQLTDYGKYHFQKGTANLFFENTYIGKTTIDPNTTSDTLEISLGQDPDLVVERSYRNFNANKVIRNSRKETLNFTIDIRNNKSESVSIKVLDQIPVSTDKAIEIKLLEKAGAELCKASGELEWLLNVPPNQSKELKFSYSMKYPKDKTVGSR